MEDFPSHQLIKRFRRNHCFPGVPRWSGPAADWSYRGYPWFALRPCFGFSMMQVKRIKTSSFFLFLRLWFSFRFVSLLRKADSCQNIQVMILSLPLTGNLCYIPHWRKHFPLFFRWKVTFFSHKWRRKSKSPLLIKANRHCCDGAIEPLMKVLLLTLQSTHSMLCRNSLPPLRLGVCLWAERSRDALSSCHRVC